MTKKACILSIDGGGIRGVIPGVILQAIETKLQEASGNNDARLADYFDLMAGTSTGGILTCIYLTPDENGKPKYSAEEAVGMYFKRGGDIFDVSLGQKIRSLGGVIDEKYPSKNMNEALTEYFGDVKLSELIRPCLITSYDIRNRKAHFFKRHRASSEIKDYYVRRVARATSAAPTYFPVALVESLAGAAHPLVDGGVFANNPAMCGYAEARNIDFNALTPGKPTEPEANEMMVVSISTGSVKEPYYYDKAKDWGMVQWIQPLIHIMMSGNSETVDYQLRKLFDSENSDGAYHRLHPGLYNASHEMDDASPKNLQALKEAGLQYIEANNERLDTIVQQLLANN